MKMLFGNRECRKAMANLQYFLDGHADAPTTDAVGAHLDTCRECGLEAEVYRQIKNTLRRKGDADPEVLARLRSFANDLCEDES